jgi:hypothetical protein
VCPQGRHVTGNDATRKIVFPLFVDNSPILTPEMKSFTIEMNVNGIQQSALFNL